MKTEKIIFNGTTGYNTLFRTLVENMMEGIVIVDWDTTILFANEIAAKLLEFESVEDIIGHKSQEYVHPDSKELLLKNLQKIKHGERKLNNEYKFTTKKGKPIWVETCGTKITLGGHSADLVTFNDITERKRADKALRESEELYRKLVQTSPDAVTASDIEGKITHISQRTLELHGCKRADEILGKNALEFIAPKDHERAMINIKKTLEEGVVKNVEYTMLRKDGTSFIGELNATLIKDAEGNPKAFIAVARDITERKHAEEKLRENEEKFRLFFENEPEYCYMISHEGKILDINKSALKTLGYKKEEIVGKPILTTIYAPSSRKKARQLFKKWKKTGKLGDEELNIITKDGKEKTVLLSADSARDTHGNILYSISVQRDITQRKKAEDHIKAQIKEKEILLKEIHHRVKNNMQIISSLLNLQSRQIKDKRLLEIFKDSQTRIQSMALVHDELYQSKDFANINFSRYIRTLASDVFQTFDMGARITLTVKAEDISLGVDTAIPCGLIINELISNSLKHAFPDKKGEITVKFRTTNDDIELIVSDNGVGIPDTIDFRTTTSLGLHLVTIVAEGQLGGTITLDRSKGTEFRITFKRKINDKY
ncbi:MAG: PAS domain S-box protein [Candidatus Methanofastidiosia archaeon]|jgi:PAS domain S-box-containing protein